MSRHIPTVNSAFRTEPPTKNGDKLLFTRLKGKVFALYLQDGVLLNAQTINLTSASQIGEIYIGKVKNIVKNIDSCFVEIADGQVCYLPLKDVPDSEKLVQGYELPVQIVRDSIKTKVAAVTTAIELPSEYFVFKNQMNGLGISNKIDKEKTRHIKALLSKESFQHEFLPEFGVVVRTKCQELDDAEFLERFQRQKEEFIEIFRKAKYRTCFSCIKTNPSPVISFLQQNASWSYQEILTDIPEIYEELSRTGNSLPAIRFYTDESISLRNLYSLQTKLDEACSTKVWLKSGANLIIEQTECLTAIDVNSSKNIQGKITEESNFEINMEAAKEAARQIRLRNLSGIIIIDFINMKDSENINTLLHFLRTLTANDPVTTRVIDMTPLGLVEITRKKIHMSLSEQIKE